MNEKKIKFFGDLNMAVDFLKASVNGLKQLWEDGDIRLRADEIGSIDKVFSEIEDLISDKPFQGDKNKPIGILRFYRNKFQKIANGKLLKKENEGDIRFADRANKDAEREKEN